MGTNLDPIPQEIRELAQWVCHRDGDKVPIDPKTGRNAKANDPATWGTFEQATEWAATNGGGIGFEFTENDPFCGIDLDHVLAEDGTLAPEAWECVGLLDTYTEISPSGTGLHLIARATKPEGRSKRTNADGTAFEMYDHRHYFRMTSDVFEGHDTINDRQEAVNKAHARWIADREPSATPSANGGCALDWDGLAVVVGGPTRGTASGDVMERMRSSPNWDAISRLLDGDTFAYEGDKSAADMALCNHLAYYCDRDEVAMDEVFRNCGLMRPKWDEKHFPDDPYPTYGAHTIHEAATTCGECYSERRCRDGGREATDQTRDGRAVPSASFGIMRAVDWTGPNTPELRPALIDDLMRRGGKCLIVGPMKSHKSMEAIYLSLALATGGEWFGHMCQPSRVLYVNVELQHDEFHNRLEAVRKHMGLGYLSYEDMLDTVSIAGETIDGRRVTVESLRSWIEAQPGAEGYDVIVIDPIYKLEEGEETHEMVNEMLLQLDMLRRDLDCSIVYVHHTAKGGAAGKTVYELARGSGDFGGDADLVIGISELSPLKEGTDAWERAQALGIGSPEHSGYCVQFGPRSFADCDSLRTFKTWPLFTVDEWGVLSGISQRGDAAHEKGGSATGQAWQARRNQNDEAVTRAVRVVEGRGEQPTRAAVYAAMDRTCKEVGIDRPTMETFRDWTRRADGCTRWRTKGGGTVLYECARGEDGRARYDGSKPVFLEEDGE